MIAFSYIDTESCDGRHPAPTGYEDITVVAGQVTILTKNLVNGCVGALVNFENGPFRARHDGGAPVAGTSGYLRSSGDEYFFAREEALRLAVVFETGGISGNLRVTYYG